MCKFCSALLENKKIYWQERSTVADDNFCETVCNNDCDGCHGGDKREFTLTPSIINGNVYVSVDYYREAYETIIYPFSELMPFSYCPFCGKQISKSIEPFNENDHRYSVEDV